MAKRYILTLMAANQVGIMAAFTKALLELKGDLIEISQTVMQNFFTTILAAEFPEQLTQAQIVQKIKETCDPFGVEVCIKDPSRERITNQVAESEHYFLTITGTDKPGIVMEISVRLTLDQVDITDMYAMRDDRDATFTMILELAVPSEVSIAKLKQDLARLESESGLSVTLQHEDIFTATNDPRPVRIALSGALKRHFVL